jgi:1,4-alpha-glucan branching enzyme
MRALALVLHAHLPHVRDDAVPFSRHERWLHEALWESYLPLVEMLERLARDRVPAPITLSVSPTLASMWCDTALRRRFGAHLDALIDLNATQPGDAAAGHAERLSAARTTWQSLGGDVLAALVRLHRAGAIELMTTSASHAFLPALEADAARAQLELGRASFAALAGMTPEGGWLPECAIDARVERALAHEGVMHTVVAEHAQPSHSAFRAPSGVTCFCRDREASLRVWSREHGYPGHPSYREFYRSLEGELGPLGAMLKFWRITDRDSDQKQTYDPHAAASQTERDADDYLGWLERRDAPLSVAAFDAELFGHWWFEGPRFLERVLRGAVARGKIALVSLAGWLARGEAVPCRHPAASSWGQGGYAAPWVGTRSGWLWRHIHHAHRIVKRSVATAREVDGVRGQAVDQAVRELMLLEASDWAFMLDRNTETAYARARFAWHHARALRFAAIA